MDPSECRYQDHYENDVDVLLGRGGPGWPGRSEPWKQEAYMSEVRELLRSSYRVARKEDKKQISLQLVQFVERRRGGKLMAYDEDEKKWSRCIPIEPGKKPAKH